jgi:hypothetical protein
VVSLWTPDFRHANYRSMTRKLMLLLAIGSLPWTASSAAEAPTTEAALQAAGQNRAELTKALSEVPVEQREGMRFLIDNMPPVDLTHLTAEFLLSQVNRSYQVMATVPWAKVVPHEIFLNDVLAYSCVNECRDNSRAKMAEIAAPLVTGCKTPGEAALLLNRKLFGIINVRYSTQRKKPDQSALESMESGVATCTGLSILLVEACRSVGVPARLVGTPMWTNLRGNHTWVEIWDGAWHFIGAAEPDAKGLNHGWFKNDAAAADNHKPEHRIYASSFKRTGISFPLVWDPSIHWVPAVNVTERYTEIVQSSGSRIPLLVQVLDKPNGIRVAAKVTVTDSENVAITFTGTSSNSTADLNNFLTFQLLPGRAYAVVVESGPSTVKREVTLTKEIEQPISFSLTD